LYINMDKPLLTTIKCKYCGRDIEISEALRQEFENEFRAEEREKAKKEVLAEIDLKIKDKDNENEELKSRNKELGNQILELTKSIRELKNQNDRRELENLKKIAEERDKAGIEAAKLEREKSTLELDELKKKLTDTERALIDAQAKAKQGSQQLQGEVLELDLETRLKNAFVNDEITPIGKGVEGGDIIQKVRNQAGKVAGIILWETKRAKWSPSWLSKLREDGRKIDATLVVLVSVNLPKEIDNFQVLEGVIVASYRYALSLAGILRRNVMSIASAKFTAENKDEKLEFLYQYLQSEAFRNRFEAFAEGVVEMQEDLLAEKRAMERSWKRRETQIGKSVNNLSKMYGELQGIMGSSLPDIKYLSLPGGEDEEGRK
jgi:hypothetical protein